jgi:hypothetical protein
MPNGIIRSPLTSATTHPRQANEQKLSVLWHARAVPFCHLGGDRSDSRLAVASCAGMCARSILVRSHVTRPSCGAIAPALCGFGGSEIAPLFANKLILYSSWGPSPPPFRFAPKAVVSGRYATWALPIPTVWRTSAEHSTCARAWVLSEGMAVLAAVALVMGTVVRVASSNDKGLSQVQILLPRPPT